MNCIVGWCCWWLVLGCCGIGFRIISVGCGSCLMFIWCCVCVMFGWLLCICVSVCCWMIVWW